MVRFSRCFRRKPYGKALAGWREGTNIPTRQKRLLAVLDLPRRQQRRISTKEESLALAKQIAEDWYLTLVGKQRAGALDSGPTFKKAADQFLKEYAVITEGERSGKWTESHAIRLRIHLVPFFGDLPLNKVTPGKVQEYRVHRMTTFHEINPLSKSKHKPRTKPPARSTLHDEIVTLRLILKTAILIG